jgi:hypothetical protein
VLVRTILGSLAAGDSPEHILADFPSLTADDLEAAKWVKNRDSHCIPGEKNNHRNRVATPGRNLLWVRRAGGTL